MGNNIQQIREDYFIGKTPVSPPKTIIMPPGSGTTIEYNYYDFELPTNTFKIGYCCEPKGISYPIFITTTTSAEQKFEIGKTGMFEVQPEDWKNINVDQEEEETAEVYVTKVSFPSNIKFVFDYCFRIE